MPLIPDASRNVAAGMTVAASFIAGLYLGHDILIPLALAVLLSFVLAPIVRSLTRLMPNTPIHLGGSRKSRCACSRTADITSHKE